MLHQVNFVSSEFRSLAARREVAPKFLTVVTRPALFSTECLRGQKLSTPTVLRTEYRETESFMVHGTGKFLVK